MCVLDVTGGGGSFRPAPLDSHSVCVCDKFVMKEKGITIKRFSGILEARIN